MDMTFVNGLMQAPPVMVALQYVILEVSKRGYEKFFPAIPSQLIPALSIILAGLLTLPTGGNPVMGALIGAAASGLHDLISAPSGMANVLASVPMPPVPPAPPSIPAGK